MKKIIAVLSLSVVLVGFFVGVGYAAQPVMTLNTQPVSATVHYGATAEPMTFLFFFQNDIPPGPHAKPVSFTPLSFLPASGASSSLISHVTFENGSKPQCGNSDSVITIPANPPAPKPATVCQLIVKFNVKGNPVGAATFLPPINYVLKVQYNGARKSILSSSNIKFKFATGKKLTQTRTYTFVNKCHHSVWLGVSSGATDALKPNPAISPADPKSCVIDSDCYPGSKCLPVSATLKHCFWENPAPTHGKYELAPYVSGQPADTSTVVFPEYDNGIDTIWSGGVAGRSDCSGGVCASADCGNAVAGTTGACKFGQGFNAPATLAEFTMNSQSTLVNSNTPNGNIDVDTYDVTVINGMNGMNDINNMGISMKPDAPWAGTKAPYSCGIPGDPNLQGAATDPNHLGACKWQFTPPSGNSTDYLWVSYLIPHGKTQPKTCTQADQSNCTGAEKCGLSFNKNALPGSKIAKTCGIPLGYWTADGVCAKDKAYNKPPFNCATSLPSPQATYTFFDLYGCTRDELKQSCYKSGSTTCCGCADWGALGQGIDVPIPTDQNGDKCLAKNPIWVANAQPTLIWLKKACPTVYTYPFDDKSSTFTCQKLASQPNPINTTNYTVTFCPANT